MKIEKIEEYLNELSEGTDFNFRVEKENIIRIENKIYADERQDRRMSSIGEYAYILYKQDWVNTHTSAEMRLNAIRSFIENRNEYSSFEVFLDEAGYDGVIYACYEEFIENEYLDKEYISRLFNNNDLLKMYDEDISSTISGSDIVFVSARVTLNAKFTKDELKQLIAFADPKAETDEDEREKISILLNRRFPANGDDSYIPGAWLEDIAQSNLRTKVHCIDINF